MAILISLWLGLAAPTVSPVAPAAAVAVVAAPAGITATSGGVLLVHVGGMLAGCGDQVGPFSPAMLRHSAPGLLDRDVFLCGPPGLADAVRRALDEAGLLDEQLHEERFDFRAALFQGSVREVRN